MTLPFWILAVVYLILVGVFALYSFFNLYHLLRFGSPVVITLTISTLYLMGTAVLLITSWMFLQTIDWSTSIQLLPSPESFGDFG